MLDYLTKKLIGGAVISFGDLAPGETEEGVVIEPVSEISEADAADQIRGTAGAFFIKYGFQVRTVLPRYLAVNLAMALGLSVDSSGGDEVIDLRPPTIVPQQRLRLVATRADGRGVVWDFPAAMVVPPSGTHTIGRDTAAGIAVTWKSCVDPDDRETHGKIAIEAEPSS